MDTSKPTEILSNKFTDERGHFIEMNLAGIQFTGTNLSFSKAGVFRGMHTFRKKPQGKLVRCLSGSILDVIVDYRPLLEPNQKYDIKWNIYNYRLASPEKALWVPPGFLHGFKAYEDATVLYHVTGPYIPEFDYCVNPKDKIFGSRSFEDVILSEKDRSGNSWEQFIQDVRAFSLT